MSAEVFKIGYQARSRDKYQARREETEVRLGDTKSFNDRVKTVEGKTDPVSKESTPIRALQPPPAAALPVGSWRSEKGAVPDVKGRIRDSKTMKGARRGGSGRKR
jgi:hypothetical protein